MNSSLAYFILNLIPRVGPVTINRLLKQFQQPEFILEAELGELMKVDGIGLKTAEAIVKRDTYVNWEEEMEKCQKNGIELITRGDSFYPDRLREIYDAPLCLYLKGNKSALVTNNQIAIVGSRRTSFYGVNITEEFSRSAVMCGWTVVSGLARGIDTKAHQTVVDNNGTTIAVLGSGLGRIYPSENINLARQISEQGAVVSEFPLLYPPDRRSFPMRNRIISGLSLGTLVVEGGIKSGSMITALQAIEQGKPVFAVPGQICDPQSHGPHKLIKNGAKLVENFFDITEEFSGQPELPFVENVNKRQELNEIPLNALEKRIVATMKERAREMTADEISEKSEVVINQLLSALIVLEMKNVIKQLPGMRYALNKQYLFESINI